MSIRHPAADWTIPGYQPGDLIVTAAAAEIAADTSRHVAKHGVGLFADGAVALENTPRSEGQSKYALCFVDVTQPCEVVP